MHSSFSTLELTLTTRERRMLLLHKLMISSRLSALETRLLSVLLSICIFLLMLSPDFLLLILILVRDTVMTSTTVSEPRLEPSTKGNLLALNILLNASSIKVG